MVQFSNMHLFVVKAGNKIEPRPYTMSVHKVMHWSHRGEKEETQFN